MMKPSVHGGGATTNNKWSSPATNSNNGTRSLVPLHIRVDRSKPSPASTVSGGPLSQSSLSSPPPPPPALPRFERTTAVTAAAAPTTSSALPPPRPAMSSTAAVQRPFSRPFPSSHVATQSHSHLLGNGRSRRSERGVSDPAVDDNNNNNNNNNSRAAAAQRPSASMRRPASGSIPPRPQQPSPPPPLLPRPAAAAAATSAVPTGSALFKAMTSSLRSFALELNEHKSSDDEDSDDNNSDDDDATVPRGTASGTHSRSGGGGGGLKPPPAVPTTTKSAGGCDNPARRPAPRSDASSSSDDDDDEVDGGASGRKPAAVVARSSDGGDRNGAAMASRPVREGRADESDDASEEDDQGDRAPAASGRTSTPHGAASDDDRKPAARSARTSGVAPRGVAGRGRRRADATDEDVDVDGPSRRVRRPIRESIPEPSDENGNDEPMPALVARSPLRPSRDGSDRGVADEDAPDRSDSSPATMDPRKRAEVQGLLWDDDDDQNVVAQPVKPTRTAKKGGPKKVAATRASSIRRASSDSPASDPDADGSKVQKRGVAGGAPSGGRNAPGIRRQGDDVKDDSDDDDDDELDPAAVRHELHPHFDDPPYGPFEDAPLPLGEASGVPFEVPRSINRYLFDFQKEGVKFMFRKCMEEVGSILGDDMGLGKTIQVIALLAALLGKTGTRQDVKELKRRKREVKSRLRGVESDRREALQAGKTFHLPDISSEIGIPVWCPILIVVPVSVIDSWLKALKDWGHFKVEVAFKVEELFEGAQMDRLRNGQSEIMVSSHSLFQRQDCLHQLATIPWKLLVVDEFHKFKNSKKCKSTNLRLLQSKVPGLVVIGLTGTLMQNEHNEAWNQIDLVQPNLVGHWQQFKRNVADPIKHGMKKGASRVEKERGENVSDIFKEKTLPKVYLRRTKTEVLGEYLPSKDEIVVFCELSKTQKEIYAHILKQPDFVLLSHANGPCDCSKNDQIFSLYKGLKTQAERLAFVRGNKDRIKRRCTCCYKRPADEKKAVLWRQLHDRVDCGDRCPWCICFPAIAILGRLVSHVSLLQAERDPKTLKPGTRKHDEATQALEKAKAFLPRQLVKEGKIKGGYICPSALDYGDYCEMSGKLAVLSRLLTRIRREHGRVLLFSTSTMILSVIESFLSYHHTDLECRRMDGSTPRPMRDKLVEEFKTNPKILVFLLSTKAMGLGLNLTEANNVIIFDVEWNPSWDEQAQDRAYRIGQKKDVRVYRLVARGTVEELKYLRQIYKKQLNDKTFNSGDDRLSDQQKKQFRGVARDKDNKGELFGMANLLKFRDGTFMKYQSSSAITRKRKDDVDQIVATDILTTVQEMTEDVFMSIGDDDQVAAWDALTQNICTDEPNYNSDSDATAYFEDCGAESQVNIGIMNRAEVASDMPDSDHGIPRPTEAATAPNLPRPDRAESRGLNLYPDRASSTHAFAENAEAQPVAPDSQDFSHISIHLPTKSKGKGKKSKKRKLEES